MAIHEINGNSLDQVPGQLDLLAEFMLPAGVDVAQRRLLEAAEWLAGLLAAGMVPSAPELRTATDDLAWAAHDLIELL